MTRAVRRRARGLVPRRTWTRWSIRFRDLETWPPIVMYQMGKVGSQTIRRALQEARVPNPMFHVHHLAPDSLAAAEAAYRRAGLDGSQQARHVYDGAGLADRLARGGAADWRFVTGMRDPIARAVSELFQVIDWRHPEFLAGGRVDTDAVLAWLQEQVLDREGMIRFALEWFEEEFTPVVGVDVLAADFDRERGHAVIEQGDRRVLVYRVESLDRVFRDGALSTFVGHPVLAPTRKVNVGADKQHSEAYREVLSRLRLPASACRALYDTDQVRHFYDEQMIEGFVARWSAPHPAR